jgi:hypothetical protein
LCNLNIYILDYKFAAECRVLVMLSDSFIHVPTPPFTRHTGSRGCQTIRQSLPTLSTHLRYIQHSDLCSSLFVHWSMHSISTLVVPEHVHLGSAESRPWRGPLTAEEEMCYSLDGVADNHGGGCCIVSGCLVRVDDCGSADFLSRTLHCGPAMFPAQ